MLGFGLGETVSQSSSIANNEDIHSMASARQWKAPANADKETVSSAPLSSGAGDSDLLMFVMFLGG